MVRNKLQPNHTSEYWDWMLIIRQNWPITPFKKKSNNSISKNMYINKFYTHILHCHLFRTSKWILNEWFLDTSCIVIHAREVQTKKTNMSNMQKLNE